MEVQNKRRITDSLMMNIVGYLAILAVTILGIQTIENGLTRIIGIALLVVFTILFALLPDSQKQSWRMHLHLGMMTLIVAGLLTIEPGWSVFPMLFFVLSPTAMMSFSPKIGMLWILGFTIVTGIGFLMVVPPLDALLVLLPYSAGYCFFGIFARALVSAEETRNESQRLLAELQDAHTQLQDYAARIEELAISEERNRLSREMHDTLGHRLTVAAVQLEGAQRLIPQDPERAVGMVATVREQVREALVELRRTVATLREPLEADLSLVSALQRLVKYFQEATDLNIHLDVPEDTQELPHPHRLALYRAAQESMTNIQKHAQAANVWLTLQTGPQVVLTVCDDGRGFPVEMRETAFGLLGMRERAAHLGGELHLGDRDGGGAKLRFTLPLIGEALDV